MSHNILGIDIGGTNFDLGIVSSGQVTARSKSGVLKTASEKELLARLFDAIDSHITENTSAIGVGVPGVVDADKGVIYDIQNIPAWKEVPLQKILEEKYSIPVRLNNDANCFALGEKYFGAGKDYANFVGLSIGTGLGMGVIINNRPYNGVLCGAGEIGMLPFKDGIVEDYAGSFFFKRKYQMSAKEIHDLALRKQPQAIEAMNEFGQHLGMAIQMILYMYAPEAIMLGGSISKAYKLFEGSMNETVSAFAYSKQIEKLVIKCSEIEDIAILGAASLCMEL